MATHYTGRRLWLCMLCLCALTACYYQPPEIVAVQPPDPPAKLMGITDLPLAPDSERIRILFIHGMGEHGPCDADTLLFHLSKALGVRQQIPVKIDTDDQGQPCPHFLVPAPTPVPAPNAHDTGLLYRFNLAGIDRQVTFVYLRWSKLTDQLKETLDERGHPHRAILNNWAKDFEQQNLSDVVLYGGLYRDVLRPVIERALCMFVEGTPDQTNPRIC